MNSMPASRASRARPSSKGVAELSASIPHVTRVPCEPKNELPQRTSVADHSAIEVTATIARWLKGSKGLARAAPTKETVMSGWPKPPTEPPQWGPIPEPYRSGNLPPPKKKWSKPKVIAAVAVGLFVLAAAISAIHDAVTPRATPAALVLKPIIPGPCHSA